MTMAWAEAGRSEVPAGGYVEYAPPPALLPYVECLWSRAPHPMAPEPGGILRHHVLPDGCIDIVIELGTRGASAMVVGTMTRALIAESTSGDSFVAVRFRPAMAGGFLSAPASELTDRRVRLGDVWRDADRVLDAVSAAGTAVERVRALAHLLVSGRHRGDVASGEVQAAVRRITAAGGSIEIAALATSLGVTRQHLARKFAEQVGVSPKTFARIARLRRLVQRVRSTVDPNWSALALELGYYDQSHLVDEFRDLAGLPPARWLRGLGSEAAGLATAAADSISPRMAGSVALR